MTYQASEYPQLCWSFSKIRLLEDCLLKYYYQTYGGHNGWMRDAQSETRMIYLLKNLKTIDALYGETFHTGIKYLIDGTIPIKNPASLKLHIKKNIQSHYKQSLENRGKWERYPKSFLMVSEVYYDCDVPQRKKASINNKTKLCSENLFSNKTFIDIVNGQACEIIDLDELRQFNFGNENIVCYLKIDALLKNKSGQFVIVDWKSSLSTSPDDVRQLLAYVYYVNTQYGVPVEMIEGRIEYIAINETKIYHFTAKDMESFSQKLEADINYIKKFVVPGTINQPLGVEMFRRTTNKNCCLLCNYRELCRTNGSLRLT